MAAAHERYPVGASVTVEELDRAPHPLLARLRAHEPVSWIPALDGWLITRYDLAVAAMRDAETFTVNDPRFSTARVIGPSMLSLDGDEHVRHRAAFAAPFRPREVRERFAQAAADEARRLVRELTRAGAGELRRGFAGPLAAVIVALALGLEREDVPQVLELYDAIVASVTEITAGARPRGAGKAAYARLSDRLSAVIEAASRDSLLAAAAAATATATGQGSALTREQLVSNAAVLLFGGIETTEGMIAGTLLHLLERPELLVAVRREPVLLQRAIEESLRVEPAAAVIDRYATRTVTFGGAQIEAGDLVRISIAAANRDPAVFSDPDQFKLEREREGGRRHLAFAHGPHVCLGVHLARLETRLGLGVLLEELPRLRLDPARESEFRGLVFRKPVELNAVWR